MSMIPRQSDPQQDAIGDLFREYQADRIFVAWPPMRNGARKVTLYRNDDDTPLVKAIVTATGQVIADVTEVIA